MVEALLFFAPASLIIIGALIVIFAKNPVHNAMGLVMTLVSLAIIYITLNATFVAMVQMLVYAGAVMTLFLFVIMMIGVDKKEQSVVCSFLSTPIIIITNKNRVITAPA